MTFAKLRQVAIAQEIDKAARAAENFEIFLAGPFVRVEQSAENEVNAATSAKKLRHSLYHLLTAKGHNIYLGEDTALRDTGQAHFADNNNAVLYERHYIVNHLDAVIVILSSPGSFCEIGDWASDPDICSTMLVVIDKKYEGEQNYINDGVVRFAKSNSAEVIYYEYEDIELLFEKCNTFIEKIAVKHRIDRLYGRRT